MRVACLLTVALLVPGVVGVRCDQSLYGLDAPVSVGPFLDGVFPTTTPLADSSWSVTDAFPQLPAAPVPTSLVIVPNPADDRLYVGSRDGQIVSFQNDPLVSTFAPFMDLRDRVAVVWDGGFLGLVFHPQFGQPGSPHEFTFYAYYASYCPTDVATGRVDFPACDPNYPTQFTSGFFGTWLRLSRFTAFWDPVDQVWKGDPASEEPMISQRLFNGSHRGGGLVFGLDGLFHVTIGEQYRFTTAQEIEDTLEGGTLRLAVDIVDHGDGSWTCPAGSHLPRRVLPDVTGNSDDLSGRLYCIPDDNPWLDPGGGLFEEYFAIGHRNPHRLALDPVTGLLWSGEIGENDREEINVVQKGRNYGWPFREGSIAGPRPPPPVILGELTEPVIDFPRSEAQAIIGGYVYRGTRIPELDGRFLAGDYATRNIWAIDLDTVTMTATKELLTTFDPGSLATFGQDNQGEILMGSVASDVPLQRLDRVVGGVPDPPALLSQLGAFDDLASLDPHDAAVPFAPLTFWSDGAEKARWLFLPNDGEHDQPEEKILFSATGNWSFPPGTVLMKHFELPVDENDPSATERLETRFLVLGTDFKWYGLTYRWDGTQDDATLLSTAETGAYTVQLAGGGTRVQSWRFPSRSECLACHNTGVSGPAGPRTHALNRSILYPATGRRSNQLRTWDRLGMFEPALDPAAIAGWPSAATLDDVEAPLELRARSYLDANCSYCHRPETGNRAVFDARLTTPLASQGLVWGGVIESFGIPDAYLVKPGDPAASLIHHRMAALGPEAMPPLAKNRVDDAAAALLAEWIERVDPELPLPGVLYEYYEESGLSALPDFDALTPVSSGAIGNFDLSPRQQDDGFAFRFTGILEVPETGDWTFSTTSDDGSQLFVNGFLVVDNDGLHPAQEAEGVITLDAGFHDIVVTMFEAGGDQVLRVRWQGPTVTRQPIPAGRLYREVPTAPSNAPPVLASPGSVVGSIGDPVDLTLLATDPDGDALFYSAANLPPGLVLDPDSGVIQGVLEGPARVFVTVVSASDGPEVSVQRFTWRVREP